MTSIQSLLNRITDFASRSGLASIGKGEFFDFHRDVVNKISEVNDNVNSVAKSLVFQDPIVSIVSTLPTTGLTVGQRYVLSTDNKIYTATSTTAFGAGVVPSSGWAVMNVALGYIYSFNGLGWKSTGLTTAPGDVMTISNFPQTNSGRKVTDVCDNSDATFATDYLNSSLITGSGFAINSMSNGVLNVTRSGRTYPTIRINGLSGIQYVKSAASAWCILAGDATSVLELTIDTANGGKLYRFYSNDTFSLIATLGNISVASGAVVKVIRVGTIISVYSDGALILSFDYSTRTESEWKNPCFGWVASSDGVVCTGIKTQLQLKTNQNYISTQLQSVGDGFKSSVSSYLNRALFTGSGFKINSYVNGALTATRTGNAYPSIRISALSSITYVNASAGTSLVLAGNSSSVLALNISPSNGGRLYRFNADGSYASVVLLSSVNVAWGSVVKVERIGTVINVWDDGVIALSFDYSTRTESEWQYPCFGWVMYSDGLVASGISCEVQSKTAIQEIDKYLYGGSFRGGKLGTGGDSISFVGKWQAAAMAKLGLATLQNIAISATTVTNTGANSGVLKYTLLDSDCDVITWFQMTNDFGLSVPLGTISDTVDTTFYGALKILCAGLVANHPNARIVFITALHRNYTGGGQAAGMTNSNGNTLQQFVDATIQVCQNNSIAVIDLYRNAGISIGNISVKLADGLHPTDDTYIQIGNQIASEIKRLGR